MVPLQFGIPGGPELLVILLVLLFLFGVPLVLVALGVVGYRRSADDDRVDELEARVEELEAELDAERGDAERADGEADAGTEATGSEGSRKA